MWYSCILYNVYIYIYIACVLSLSIFGCFLFLLYNFHKQNFQANNDFDSMNLCFSRKLTYIMLCRRRTWIISVKGQLQLHADNIIILKAPRIKLFFSKLFIRKNVLLHFPTVNTYQINKYLLYNLFNLQCFYW